MSSVDNSPAGTVSTTIPQPSFTTITTGTSGQWQSIPFSTSTGTSYPATVRIWEQFPSTTTPPMPATITIPNYHQNTYQDLGTAVGQTFTGFSSNFQWQIPTSTANEQLQTWINQNPQGGTYYFPSEETPEQKAQKAAAFEKSRELAKEWLSEKEFKALEEQGEIEIPSTKKDILYVVRKDPYRRVAKRVVKRLKGVLATAVSKMDIEEFCIHPLDPALPLYDGVLAKVLLIKGDEKLFEESANKSVLPVPIAR